MLPHLTDFRIQFFQCFVFFIIRNFSGFPLLSQSHITNQYWFRSNYSNSFRRCLPALVLFSCVYSGPWNLCKILKFRLKLFGDLLCNAISQRPLLFSSIGRGASGVFIEFWNIILTKFMIFCSSSYGLFIEYYLPKSISAAYRCLQKHL